MSSAGQALGAVVGGIVGFFATGGNPVGAFQGAALGASIGSALDPPKGPTVQGPRLSDLSVQTSTYGAFIPRVYGTIANSGNIIQLENNKLKETIKKKSSGGKGGGGGTTTKTYSYSATFQLALCEGPIAGVRRIWCGDKLIYNAGSDDLETIIASNQAASGFRIYLGTDDQLPDSRYEAEYGVGNVSAHRGMAYIAFYDFDLTPYSNTLQAAQFKVEIVTSITSRDELMFSYIGAVPSSSLPSPRPSNAQGTSLESYFQTFDGGVNNSGKLFKFDKNGNRSEIDYFSEVSPISPTETFIPDQTLSSDTLQAWFYQNTGSNDHFYIRQSGNTKYYQSTLASQLNKFMVERNGNYWLRYGSGEPRNISTLVFGEGGDTVDGQITVGSSSTISSSYSLAGMTNGNIARCLFNMPYPNASASVTLNILDSSFSTIQTDTFSISRPSTTTDQDFLSSKSFSYVDDLGVLYVVFPQDFSGNDLQDGRFFYFSFDTVSREIINDTQSLFHPTKTDFDPKLVSVKDGIMSVADAFGVDLQCSIVAHAIGIQDQQSATLSNIASSEITKSSLVSASDINVTQLTDSVRGYRVQGGSIRAALEPLQGAFPFDVIQSGYKIKCVPRGQSSVSTISWEELGATDGGDSDSIFNRSREMDTQLPARTNVKYLDAAREYALAEQYSERLNTPAINRVDRELPIVLTAAEAAGVAEVLNFLPWLERVQAEFNLPPTYLNLEPSDVITVTTPDATHELRLTEVAYTPSGRLECKAKPNRAALYTPNATGAEGVPPVGTIPLAGGSVAVLMDIPVVDETLQNAVGFVGIMTGTNDSWPGGILVRSNDGGQTWTEVQAFNGLPSYGTAVGTLPASDSTLIDQRSLSVVIVSGALESKTRDQMLSGVNYAAYGVNGRWEIVRFQNAVLGVNNTFTVSHFVRGERGTEWATGLHSAGDYFVLLDDPDNVFIGAPVESIGVARTYRAVTVSKDVDSASDISFTYQGVNLEPLSSVYAKGTRDGSSNLSVTFTRRSRLSSSWWTAGVQAPVGEDSEAYEIDILNGSTVVRTITASTSSFSYSAANQTTDFGSPQSSITMRIYQISGTVGRGYPLEVTL